MTKTISIHAPREGGDETMTDEHQVSQYFNPRPPRGGRRRKIDNARKGPMISIHAPREGGDVNFGIEKKVYYYFNPRPPRGGRLPAAVPAQADVDFNPRPPRGGRQAENRKK